MWLPAGREAVAAAVAAGRLDADSADRDGFVELPVTTDLHPPEMAAHAAEAALAAAGWPAESLDFLLHAWTHHQGLDFWSPAHYVAHRIGASTAVPVGIQQMCNGGALGLELAAARLLAMPAGCRALVTTADRFSAPAFDRWRGDYGIAYGDAATAIALGGAPASLELAAIATVAAPELEGMHRGQEPFQQAASTGPLDVRRRKKTFLAANGRDRFARVAMRSTRLVVDQVLEETADLPPGRPRMIVLPRLGRRILETAYLPALEGLDRSLEIRCPGSRTGHLGAGDLAANLAGIVDDGQPAEGETVLLLSAGGGFSWTCALVRRRS